ncbi:hypothetical protein E4U43_004893 [Claviceps pusilla]|uniref:Agroclavine dehydrogenase n=1 Tax=Claviceps pusilla TaxID=123648 RepID=A0A9P7SWJ6_9HYPO|nr:hypothetical protein E4U43_004893 [Claviceps pusilla]
MTILLTGGSGKTAEHIANLLREAKLPFIIGSRSSNPHTVQRHRTFDWLDEATFNNVQSVDEEMEPVSVVWLVSPPILDLAPPVILFIDFASSRGVKRFVLLSASTVEKGGPAMGLIHAHLDTIEGVSYTVLRPSWFMGTEALYSRPCKRVVTEGESDTKYAENFSTRGKKTPSYSAAKGGKIPFISAADIARVVALRALAAPALYNKDHLLLGPELLTYDDSLNLRQSCKRGGMPADEAAMHASLDSMVEAGAEERLNTEVKDLTGEEPRHFADFVSDKQECLAYERLEC